MLILTKVGTLSNPSPISTSAPLSLALILLTLKSNQCLRDSSDLSDIVGTSVVAPNFGVSQVSEGNHVSANPMLPLKTCYSVVFSSVVSTKSESDPVGTPLP
ncbi:hypothetical protein Tco_1157603, partial [Tanacetum coccineum]